MSYAQPSPAEDPEALLARYCLVLQDLLGLVAAAGFQRRNQSLGGLVVGLGVALGLDELVDDGVELRALALEGDDPS